MLSEGRQDRKGYKINREVGARGDVNLYVCYVTIVGNGVGKHSNAF